MSLMTDIERDLLATNEKLSYRAQRAEMDLAQAQRDLDWANRKIRRLEAVIEEHSSETEAA